MARDGDAGKEVFAETAAGRLVLGLKEPDRRAAALHLHRRLCRPRHEAPDEGWAVLGMAGMPLRWPARDAAAARAAAVDRTDRSAGIPAERGFPLRRWSRGRRWTRRGR